MAIALPYVKYVFLRMVFFRSTRTGSLSRWRGVFVVVDHSNKVGKICSSPLWVKMRSGSLLCSTSFKQVKVPLRDGGQTNFSVSENQISRRLFLPMGINLPLWVDRSKAFRLGMGYLVSPSRWESIWMIRLFWGVYPILRYARG